MSEARTVSQIKQRWITLKGSDIAEDPWIYVSDVADMLNHYDALKAENARLRAALVEVLEYTTEDVDPEYSHLNPNVWCIACRVQWHPDGDEKHADDCPVQKARRALETEASDG